MNLKLYNESYDVLCARMKKKHPRVFEIGCGPGNISRYLLEKRPDMIVEGIDYAPAMVELARKNNPMGTFRVMDCRNIDEIEEKYDAIVCGFCIPYLSVEEVGKLIHDCSNLLLAKGLLYISAIEGKHADSATETSSDGATSMLVYYYGEEEMKGLFIENGFVVVRVFRVDYEKSNGDHSVHLIFIAEKKVE